MNKSTHGWYFWTKNKYAHFIRSKHFDNQLVSGIVKKTENGFAWKVVGPCWTTYEESGSCPTLEAAQQEVDKCVMDIIVEEFREEQVFPPW